jgi:hypothetical protein
MAEDSFP